MVQGKINDQEPLEDAKIPQKLFRGNRQDHGKRNALTKGNKRKYNL